jgi:hypothetical protein
MENGEKSQNILHVVKKAEDSGKTQRGSTLMNGPKSVGCASKLVSQVICVKDGGEQ